MNARMLPDFPIEAVVIAAVMAAAMGLGPLALAWLWARTFSPGKPGPEKNANYECGLASGGDPGGHQNVHYYLYAIVLPCF